MNATRFRRFEDYRKLPVKCIVQSGCTAADCFEHLLQRTGVGDIPEAQEELVPFILRMIELAKTKNPGLPEPWCQPWGDELELPASPETSSGSGSVSGGEISLTLD